MIKDALHRLYYSVDLNILKHPSDDPPFHAALQEFEQRAELKSDGIFSVGEFEQLMYWAQLANYTDLGISPLSPKHVSRVGTDYATASGTWVIQGDQIAFPINAVDVACWRSSGNCIVADANVRTPSASDYGEYLAVAQTYYDITSWTQSRVVAESTAACRRHVITLDTDAQQVFMVTSDLKADEICAKSVGKLIAPRVSTLEDGFSVGRRHLEAVRKHLERVTKPERYACV